MLARWRIPYRRGVWLTFAAGAAFSLALFAAGTSIDAGRDNVRNDAARVAATNALRTRLDVLDGQARDVAGLFAASREVEPGEFQAFAEPMLRRSDANALSFLLDVPGAERARLERQMDITFRETAPDDTLRRAEPRRRYLIVALSTFATSGLNLTGLDVLSDGVRRTAVERAERTGGVAVVPSATLFRSGEPGILLYAPVPGRPGRPSGIVAASISHRALFATVRRGLARGVGVRLTAGGVQLGTAGDVPAGAASAHVDYGGERFAVAVATPREGNLRFGPLGLALGLLVTAILVIGEHAQRTRKRFKLGEARFADAFEGSPVGSGLASLDGRFGKVNAALCAITGSTPEQLCAGDAADLVHPSDRDHALRLMARAVAEPGIAHGAEVRVLTSEGAARWTQLHFTRLPEEDGGAVLLTQVIDVSERRGLEVELRHQAEHDALTDLLNRRGFQRRLGALLERAPGAHAGAVMLIDLDHFKTVNDTLGHHVGDQVIRAAGSALRASLRTDDIVARIGGDEFAVLLPGADRERAQATAERLVQAIGDARADEASDAYGISASVGVAMLDGAFATADEALMAADLAMYDAKHAGRRRTAFYADRSTSTTQARLHWVDRIRTALSEDRLALVAQPILDLRSGRVANHEVLLRMLDADGGFVSPGEFLPIAEQFGLMTDLDRWVVTHAIAALAENPDRELVFEINLSGSSLGSPEVLRTIREALAAGDVAPGRVIFEITETAAVTNLQDAHAFAQELAALGCRFALDDFGVGFGSFAYVKHLPFDFLKIDGEFVRHSATSRADRVILESLIHAARGLGKLTIAEYVEDAGTVELLRELGVDMVQGFHVGRPEPLDRVIAAAPVA
ncbi:MAG TPA: EAL domain-containing protein [Solirubrobacter sp.]|nr:EAL domain-containing protein [Solirubrobacter sp.]